MFDLNIAYQTTPHLSDLLAQWDTHVTDEGPLSQRRWTDIALWPAARSATVAGSTAIEGNPLSLARVDEVLSGINADPRQPDIREVLNYNAALDLANRAALRPDFEWTQELIRRLNAAVMQGLEDDERGEYRHQPVNVGAAFFPPDAARLPRLMGQLTEWLQREDDAHPLIRAGLTHLNVVSIHPWLNGNGRTARVAGSLMLMRCGIGAPELLNIESEIRASRDRYFAVLHETQGPTYQPDEHSSTPWLEYFAEICVRRLDLRNRVTAAFPGDFGLLAMELGGRATPERVTMLIAARITPIRTPQVAALLGLSAARARAILAGLAAEGWLEPIGERRARRYGSAQRLRDLPLRTADLMERLRSSEETAD